MGGGVRRHIIDIVNHINLSKYTMYIIYGAERCDSVFRKEISSLEKKGIHIVGLSSFTREISPLKDLKSLIFLIWLIIKVKPDIIHCHSSKAGALGRLAGFLTGKKSLVYTPHGYAIQAPYLNKIKAFFYWIVEKILAKITAITINVSYGEKKFAVTKGILKENQSIVILNGIENNNTYNRNNDHHVLVIGTIARFDAQKDPYTFYEIAKRFVLSYPNVIFKYYGDGELKQDIEIKIKNDNLEDKIILPGFVENPISALCELDIFISTSLHEGMPYSLIEACSVGLPIIATDVTGNNEIVQDNYNGYLFPSGNIDIAVEKIKNLIINPETMNLFGKRSKQIYIEKFKIDTMIEKLEAIYDRY